MTPRNWNLLLAAIALECLVFFGPGLKALAFATFGCAVLAIAREESTSCTSDRIVGAWLSVLGLALLAIAVASHELAYTSRPFIAAVLVGGAALTAHLLHPSGLGRREVLHSTLVAFGLGFAGWNPVIAAFAAALVLAAFTAGFHILRNRPDAPVTVRFSSSLALVTVVALPFA